MIRIATAECFTHGLIGREIHAFSRGYPRQYSWKLDPRRYRLSLVCGLFIPTLSGVRSILRISPVPPFEILDGIKVYDQESDDVMALRMAEAVREITRAHIGIGTTAGIGRGSIAVAGKELKLLTRSDVYADLRSSDPSVILARQESGIRKCLHLLEDLIGNDLQPSKDGNVIRFP
ncbi:UPF0254 family protein [Methanoregula sp.]|uniref:UPF0254 family protein n=1 Tax=Methanoregula sp. TaxID=2052170 RepID=UPI00262A3308|nr:UPF0254 family protein [Methanoregula sp.]MDD5143609.1 UPF0254 family protein [Methanoregula sp.]